jgi:histidinol phosphatase-like PHP family hydrolase
VKIDLHVHSKERSTCGRASEEEQIRAAIDSGLDAIVFTDHHRLISSERLQQLNEKYAPFRIFGGVEIAADGEDVLVLGAQDPALESLLWSYPALHAFVRARGGFIALAHPFRWHSDLTLDLERFVPDAIEVGSLNTPRDAEGRIRDIAARLGIPVLCNSDAHNTGQLGMYFNALERAPADEQDLVALLRSGQFSCSSPEQAQS